MREVPPSPESSVDAPETCRTCGAVLPDDAPMAPFCSPRCRMADLGKWFRGDYRTSRELTEDDVATFDA